MDHGPLGPAQGLVRASNQMLPGLGKHHDGHIVGNQLTLYQEADEVIISLGGRGESHLDLLEAHGKQEVPETQLPFGVHRVHQGLVTVAQVDGAPAGRPLQGLLGPGPLWIIEGNLLVIGHVLGVRHGAGLLGRANEPTGRQQQIVVTPIGRCGLCREIEYGCMIPIHHSSFCCSLVFIFCTLCIKYVLDPPPGPDFGDVGADGWGPGLPEQ